MKHLVFLKPLFSLGILVFLAFLLFANLLVFKYLPTGAGAFWFILVEELAAIFGYIIARSIKNADVVMWGFAKEWWADEVTVPKEEK